MNTLRYLLARYLCMTVRYKVFACRTKGGEMHDADFDDYDSAMARCIELREQWKQSTGVEWCVERQFVWAVKQNPPPTEGQLVLIDAFLWWPLTIKGETRWWERAQYMMVCHVNRAVDGYVSPFDWEVVDWVG